MLSIILIFFCIFEMRNNYNLNDSTVQKTNQTDRRENESVSTSLRKSLCSLFRSDLSIFKNSIMRNKLQGSNSTDEKKLALLNELLSYAKPETFIENITANFVNGITEEMKNFELTGKEVSNKIFFNQQLIRFFYDLGALNKVDELERKLRNINTISS